MRIENPYNHRVVERELRRVYMPSSPNKRLTRCYIRKMSRHIEHAYEIGRRDGATDKRLVQLEELLPDGSQLAREMESRAYAAYKAGYEAGKGA